MSSNIIIKLTGWRVRDLTACFYASKLPAVDDEPNPSTSTDRVPRKKTMVFDPIGESKRRQTDRQKLRRKKSNEERASLESSNRNTKGKTREDHAMAESSITEEEYIVFCFKDDGTIDIVKENSPSEATSAIVKTKTHKCGESAEKTCSNSYVDVGDRVDDRKIIAANEAGNSVSDEQVEGEGSNDVEAARPLNEIKEINDNGNHESKTLHSMLSAAESSDSNQSDASSGSFAFPTLRWEWMDSPVHMPKPEDVGLRTNKARGVRLYCCRF